MKCVVGIDLGSTTTKAVLLDEDGRLLGRGITNSRSDYDVACAVAREEALTAARFDLLARAIGGNGAGDANGGTATAARAGAAALLPHLREAFRLVVYRGELAALAGEMDELLASAPVGERLLLQMAVAEILAEASRQAPALFVVGVERRSDFFRDLAGAAWAAGAEAVAARGKVRFERLLGLWDRAILTVETRLRPRPFGDLLADALGGVLLQAAVAPAVEAVLEEAAAAVAAEPLEETAFVGTGYGRQTLPFPKEAIRSEILCHGRGAHATFPATRTVLDIGGQDTKAIQVDDQGVVRAFQMNDRCAAGCGRFLGYLADELNLGLHELGPLALQARKSVRVSSTCTVFAGAELRERLALGERREDVLAGLHRAMMLRAMSLLARSGGVADELTFTGGVSRNGMAVKVLRELVEESYGEGIHINVDADSIYTGAFGAALFARDNQRREPETSAEVVRRVLDRVRAPKDHRAAPAPAAAPAATADPRPVAAVEGAA
jgi:benzoyl-CoA reductase subunit A